jgi:hypothetical protein
MTDVSLQVPGPPRHKESLLRDEQSKKLYPVFIDHP